MAQPQQRLSQPPAQGSSLVRSLASNWVGLAIGVGTAFFLSPFVVHRLGAAWYGVWAVAGQFTGYLWLLDFGVRESIVRYTSKYAARRQSERLNPILTAAVIIYSATALLTVLLTMIVVWGAPYWFRMEEQFWRDARFAIAFAGLTIAQTFLFNVFNGIVMGLRRWDLTTAIGVGSNLLRTALIVVFLLRGDGIVAIAIIQFAVGTVAGLVTIRTALSLLGASGLRFRPVLRGRRHFMAISRRILGYGALVAVNNVGEKIITATDAIVVGLFLPITSVAYYAVAGSLIGFLKSLVTSSAPVFNPLASHLHAARQQGEVRRALLLGMTISVLITMPVAAGFVVLGEQFIRLWMGQEFANPSGAVLAVLAVAVVLAAPRYIITNILYGISRHRITAILRVTEAAANLGLSIVLVQVIGLTGVALGTLIPTAVIALLVLPVVTWKAVGVRLRDYYGRAFLRPMLAILPFAAGAHWFRAFAPAQNLLVFCLQIAALLMVYAPCALMVAFDQDERRLILRRFGVQQRDVEAARAVPLIGK